MRHCSPGSLLYRRVGKHAGRGTPRTPYPQEPMVGQMSLHEQSVGATDEWYTPPYVFEALGCDFDLDVASPGWAVAPWIPTARLYISAGLEKSWHGFIWMNPPFGGRNGLVPWLEKFVEHGSGICLVPDRTSAPWWQWIAARVDLILFVAGKIKFIGIDGQPGRSPAQGTCLMAIGERGCLALHTAAQRGLGLLQSKPLPPGPGAA